MIALASLLPLILFLTEFRTLYWFHDDLMMLDGAARRGFWRWLSEPFANESVIPLSKAFWIMGVRLTGGSYFGMVVLVFATHAANVWLYGEILRRLALPAGGIAFALITFALPWTNIETLGWAMQWTAVLSLTFFLLAWLHLVRWEGTSSFRVGVYALLLLASALTSSRGIICGLVMAIFILFRRPSRRLVVASLAPAIALTGVMVIVKASTVSPPLLDAARYALHYYFLNPLYLLLPIPEKTFDVTALLLCGTIKLTIIAAAWQQSTSWRPLLAALLSFDLFTALSLAFARATTGLDTSISYRYQYIPLFCFGLFAGLLLSRVRRRWVAAAVVIVWAVLVSWPWRRHTPRWAQWRGTEVRRTVELSAAEERLWPSEITVGRARELIAEYRLH